ncbi:hypothetical protein ATCC90586_008373 [Pythium insidiosum]|nr:hypothetical protein ATCC90586_008373 [Pythium insidiosum]
MASSIARGASFKKRSSSVSSSTASDSVDVVTAFSTQTSAIITRRRSSLVQEDLDADTTLSPRGSAKMDASKSSASATSGAAFDMEEIQQKLKELERQPTQEEINELLAQYDDYSDGSGSEESDDDSDGTGKREDVIMKVLVVGNARCGKTSTIRRFVSKDFSDEYVSTIGADFVEKVVDYDDNLRLHLQLWDIAGQDRFAKLTRAYFRDAKGALIVCDITRENTIDAVVTWKNEIDVCCKDLNHGEVIPVVMVANKSDLLQDPMGALNIGVNMQKCVVNNGIVEWFRASAKSGEHVDDAFQCLIDRMVEDHRKQQQQRQSTSTASGEDNAGDDDDAKQREGVIRLSQYKPPASRDRSDSGMCDCN